MTFQIGATLVVGLLALAAAWLPVLLRAVPVTIPIIAVAFGALLFLAVGRPDLDPYRSTFEHLTEYVLVIAVMGAGLKIDRAFRPWAWKSTWLLLAIAMPISIGLTAVVSWWLLGLSAGLSLLVASILSPTDPVLASDVQVGPPGEGEEGEVRFALTSEAGLNDGIAMPFVVLAVAMLTASGPDAGWHDASGLIGHWVLVDLLWRVAAGTALGAACGWGLVSLDQALPERLRLHTSHDGLAVLGVSLLVYAVAELGDVNGFVAVFAAAVAARNAAPGQPDFARALHGFADQLERFATVLLMTLFGALLAGGILRHLTWADAAFMAIVMFGVRPIAVLVSCIGSGLPYVTRLPLGYFGIRGLGSLFYLFFALARVELAEADHLRAIVALAVLASMAVYGMSAAPVMRIVDARRRRDGAVYKGPVLERTKDESAPASDR